jgi:hypothetical protein
MHKIKEPIPVGPFLEWAARREQILGVQYNTGREDEGGIERLLDECGWNNPAGHKRLYRWRYELVGGHVERATVEDALHHAGYLFTDIYPDLPEPEVPVRWTRQQKQQRRMTDEQVIAAHTVYVRAKLTQTSLAELLYEKYGYANAWSCSIQLVKAFRSMGLPARRCTSTTHAGTRCERNPLQGMDVCALHDPARKGFWSEIAVARGGHPRFELPEDLLHRARIMREEWSMSWLSIARSLIPETPLTSVDHLAKRLGEETGRPVYAMVGAGWEQVA